MHDLSFEMIEFAISPDTIEDSFPTRHWVTVYFPDAHEHIGDIRKLGDVPDRVTTSRLISRTDGRRARRKRHLRCGVTQVIQQL